MHCVVQWLNTNAGVVQALASVVGVATTIVLAVLTGRYVKLTRSIAQAASKQAILLQQARSEAQESAERALFSLALRVQASFLGMDPASPNIDELRHFTLVSPRDADQLEGLARSVGGDKQAHALAATLVLRSLLGVLGRIQATSIGQGYALSPTESTTYKDSLEALRVALTGITGAD